MNFLAHLWLADSVRLPLAGAILGDVVRGRIGALPGDSQAGTVPSALPIASTTSTPATLFPAEMALSIRLHRRIDAVTDRHPRVLAAIERFEPGRRRYAGVLLDLIYDHALALHWQDFSGEALELFARRASRDVAAAGPDFIAAGAGAPRAWSFRRLLVSYRSPAGMDRAIRHTATRLRKPEGLLEAAQDWQRQIPRAIEDLPKLLRDLAETSRVFVAENTGYA